MMFVILHDGQIGLMETKVDSTPVVMLAYVKYFIEQPLLLSLCFFVKNSNKVYTWRQQLSYTEKKLK